MKALLLISLIFMLGCQSSPDLVTIQLLNQRITELEKKTYCYVIIKNPNGSRTSVRLRLEEGKYIGPNNEVYDILPTPDQLAPYYGLAPKSENIKRTDTK